jgi:hypothetical protein
LGEAKAEPSDESGLRLQKYWRKAIYNATTKGVTRKPLIGGAVIMAQATVTSFSNLWLTKSESIGTTRKVYWQIVSIKDLNNLKRDIEESCGGLLLERLKEIGDEQLKELEMENSKYEYENWIPSVDEVMAMRPYETLHPRLSDTSAVVLGKTTEFVTDAEVSRVLKGWQAKGLMVRLFWAQNFKVKDENKLFPLTTFQSRFGANGYSIRQELFEELKIAPARARKKPAPAKGKKSVAKEPETDVSDSSDASSDSEETGDDADSGDVGDAMPSLQSLLLEMQETQDFLAGGGDVDWDDVFWAGGDPDGISGGPDEVSAEDPDALSAGVAGDNVHKLLRIEILKSSAPKFNKEEFVKSICTVEMQLYSTIDAWYCAKNDEAATIGGIEFFIAKSGK